MSRRAAESAPLLPWELALADAVADVIAFWNFKPSHARVWTLLYVRDSALDAGTLQRLLGLSKGSVSMSVRELERWGVLHREEGDRLVRYRAEKDFFAMISRVLAEREGALVDRAARDIARAEHLASEEGVDADALARVERLRQLAELVSAAIRGFLVTASLDGEPFLNALGGESAADGAPDEG